MVAPVPFPPQPPFPPPAFGPPSGPTPMLGGPGGAVPPMPGAVPPPPPAPPPLDDSLAWNLASMTDRELKAYLDHLSVEESIAFLQLLVEIQATAPGLVERIQGLVRPKERATDPKPPKGWAKPPRPTWGDVSAFASKQERKYARFRDQIAYDLEVYSGRRTGVFQGDQERFKKGKFEAFWSTALKDDADLARATVATAPIAIKHRARHEGIKRESQQCEDALREWRRANALRWSEGPNSILAWDEASYLVLTGVIIGRSVIDPLDPACPIRYDLIDPTTCYPEYGGRRGITRLVRKYAAPIARIAGDYGSDEATVAKMRKFKRGGADRAKDEGDLTLDAVVDTIEYWDTLYRGVWLSDGTEILPLTEHKYYSVPFDIQIGAAGLPQGLAFLRTEDRIGPDGRVVQEATADDDPSRIIQSHIHNAIPRHLQDEAIHAKLYNAASRALRPAVGVFQDEYARTTHKQPEVSHEEGAVNRFLKDHEEVRELTDQPNPAVFGPILQKLQQDKTTNQAPLAMYGATQNSQATGNAVETLQEAGRDKHAWIFAALELYYARVFRRWLTLFQQWGHILGEPGRRGELDIQYDRKRRRARDEDAYFTITPEIVKTAGCDVIVDLTDVAKKNLAALAAAGATLRQNGFASTWWIQDNLFNFDDPDEMQQEINLEDLMRDPVVKELALKRDIRRAFTDPLTGELDPEGQEMLALIDRKMNGSSGGPPQGQMPPQGPPGMGPPGPMMPGTSGTDLTAFNPAVGMGAGRPPLPMPAGPVGPF